MAEAASTFFKNLQSMVFSWNGRAALKPRIWNWSSKSLFFFLYQHFNFRFMIMSFGIHHLLLHQDSYVYSSISDLIYLYIGKFVSHFILNFFWVYNLGIYKVVKLMLFVCSILENNNCVFMDQISFV